MRSSDRLAAPAEFRSVGGRPRSEPPWLRPASGGPPVVTLHPPPAGGSMAPPGAADAPVEGSPPEAGSATVPIARAARAAAPEPRAEEQLAALATARATLEAERAEWARTRRDELERERAALRAGVGDVLARALAEAHASALQVASEAQERLVALAAAIATKVIGRELETPRPVLEALVREGLEALSERDRLVVRVGPGFRQAAEGLRAATEAGATVPCTVVVEPDAPEYQCVLEGDLGRIDISLQRRLDAVLGGLGVERLDAGR
ncbi:MAG: hypothetical protein IT376_15340 [Polyangiaceae bacterium]|nr:hypothetical protein [Polyangiaceae bacterium]